MDRPKEGISRRGALLTGAGVIGSALALGAPASILARTEDKRKHPKHPSGTLPVKQIEDIFQTQGKVSKGVLGLMLFRTDLHLIGPDGARWSPYFQSMDEFYFQPLGRGLCIMNCDITFTEEERERALDAVLRNGLQIQAQHQHYIGERPQTWHYHFRKIGDPIKIAHECVDVMKATHIPFPQSSSSNPTTPLPKDEMAKILGGTADVREDGIVEISVDRRNRENLAGVDISPELNIASSVTFQPLNSRGTLAIVGPDIGMTSSEVQRTLIRARSLAFQVHCLYNQETAERPQLYFSHLLKHGAPLDLARQVRRVLDETDVDGSPRRDRDSDGDGRY
ncbi:MAG TPA: DUF1259 domain-containing protein [Chloroflexota bacterium]|nr:DUF1259 domain-containing protein [Chloroflexota bacterium]